MLRILFALSILTAFIQTNAQSPVRYSLELGNIHHHELRINVMFSDLTGETLEIRMPNTSPGRYAAHNFVKNVYEEVATDGAGNPLVLKRITPFSWEVPVTGGTVNFTYTLYGNHADGTYMGVDAKKLHMNMPATFVYAPALQDREIQLIIPADNPKWDVATQLIKKNDSTFSAPDYYYFYDSPTLVGEISWRRWEVSGQTIEIAMMHEGTEAELDGYTEWVKAVVLKEQEIYGALPKFDFGRYTFLMAYNPWVDGDGMEHRNSTVCTGTGDIKGFGNYYISTVAHEFFHAWNIERIRPASLEPFDFDVPNLSEALWFGEGFTSYFDKLVITRAKILEPEQYIKGLVSGLNYVLNSPGRSFRNPIEMSQNAPFTDAGTANDETNYANNFISYYSYGAILGLGLDLTLRTKYDKTLDAYMKAVWLAYGQPEIPYTMTDLQNVLGELTKDKEFAAAFFRDQIYGSDLPDFEALFAEFGIKMSLQNPGSAYFGNPKLDDDGYVQSTILRGTAFYEAGIEKGDQILSMNGREVSTTSDLNRVINSLEIGKEYPVTYKQFGEEKTATFTTVQDPRITLSYLPNNQLKKAVVKRRNRWLQLTDE
ncbi:M61 family metallopeptidase [Marinoscillum sp.]|uniref:M61 family metallopeptidase n=1 Tax=Marinoscillum sp. TaxID=2024838 RepID=UPI003BAD2BBD